MYYHNMMFISPLLNERKFITCSVASAGNNSITRFPKLVSITTTGSAVMQMNNFQTQLKLRK